ncbi:D-2-hydroxyacid dehydrogenase [Shewanella sp. Scap07]|uniref:D-2-hydroxyacid dehydrogenase n=1 Tax=Shewanella sp. Scap07 TaxID=2589987 RepID=UPI0015B9BDB2|nr:D-2-hydroxyacid dehydrogenase [Shewanella sp. Scap07]QLE84414.1 D-2-hydroxyacid dehydrogenase [Shewanella sp. Scap07]
MNLVVLDGYTLNPGDISWQGFADLADITVYERSAEQQRLPRAIDAEIILTNKTVLDAKLLQQLPKLRYIGVLATGVNVVDIKAAAKLGIIVTNVPAYAPDAVAQMVFAHILVHTQQVAIHHQAVSRGQWQSCEDFCFTLSQLTSLKGKTLGLLGYGAIAQQVARIAVAFQMSVLIHTPNEKQDLPDGVRWCEQVELFKDSDILSLHCPLTPETQEIINSINLAKMKSSAMLINTARGGLVDEQALANALNRGQIAAAGLDVLSTEPPSSNNPLLTAKHANITPHNAWATREARQSLMAIAVANLQAFLAGTPENQVN